MKIEDYETNNISRLKRKFSRNPILRFITGCPYRSPGWDRKVKKMIKELGNNARILDLGSGNRRRADHIINLEIETLPNVDVVGDGHNLPFKDGVLGAVIIEAVLEHVRNPEAVVSEIHRVLRPGGLIYAGVPFIQGYHASPEDYQRYTIRGLENLFSNFQKLESGSCVGPTSALHWVFREYIGILFSFGNVWIYKALSLFIGWITFPLVYLDILLMKNRNAHAIASAVYFIGRKKEN